MFLFLALVNYEFVYNSEFIDYLSSPHVIHSLTKEIQYYYIKCVSKMDNKIIHELLKQNIILFLLKYLFIRIE